MNWIDITTPLRHNMPTWPGDPACLIHQSVRMDQGAPCNLTHLNLSAHTATHMDAPRHFIADGKTMDQLPLEAVIGPCRVLDLTQVTGQITPADLHPHDPQPGERLLLKTTNSTHSWSLGHFDPDFISLRQDAARFLVERGIRTLGIDYLSIGGYGKDVVETHHVILGAEIWVIEGLNLAHVTPGPYHLTCLPLNILGADGAPCRALLTPA